MDHGQVAIRPGERRDESLVGAVVHVDEAEVVVLAVLPPAARVIVVLEPVAADDRRLAREALRRGGGAAGALRLGRDRHQVAVVAVAGPVLGGCEEPLGDEHGLAAAQLVKALEVIGRDPAVGTVDVVVRRDRVDPRRHRAHRRRVVVDRQPVAEVDRVRVRRTQRGMDQAVVAFGDEPGPAPDHLDTGTAGTEARMVGSLGEETVERADAGGRHEVVLEARPVAAVVLAEERDQSLLGLVRRWLLREEVEERAVPPADLVVGEVADAIPVRAVRRHEPVRPGAHPPLGGGGERVDPVERRRLPEREVRDLRHAEHVRRQRPGAGGVEAPPRRPRPRRREPAREIREEARPVIRGPPSNRRAPVETVDPDGVKALASRGDEPCHTPVRGERPARVRGARRRAGGGVGRKGEGGQHEPRRGGPHVWERIAQRGRMRKRLDSTYRRHLNASSKGGAA